MAYPNLPSNSYLHPSPPMPNAASYRAHTGSSGSASSVEPVTPESTRIDNSSNESPDAGIPCKWKGCDHVSTSPDALYDHLCNVHVGRKSTNNLCLTCGWEGCGTKCVKRDHITSHLRVHTPLKPHPCPVCGKTFKRPQDLKKHERIHTQEHHQLHKLSKAATSADPVFNKRLASLPHSSIKIERRASGSSLDDHTSPATGSMSPSSSSGRSNALSASPFDHFGNPHHSVHKSVSPTPSALAALHRKQHEELAAYQQREMLVLQQLAFQQQQNRAYAAQLFNDDYAFNNGQKRDWQEENTFEDFLADMKKRKVEPVYDTDMINRLNSMQAPAAPPSFPTVPSLPNGYSQNMNGNFSSHDYSIPASRPAAQMPQQSNAAPMNIPEIRTEADLALFNQFMISLGRDAARMDHSQSRQTPQQHQSHTSFSMAPHATMNGGGSSFSSSAGSGTTGSGTSPVLSEQSPVEDLFNPEELASLGLSGMPGIPNNSFAPQADHNNTSSSLYGHLYNQLEQSKRVIAGLPRASHSHDSSRQSYDSLSNANAYPTLPNFGIPDLNSLDVKNFALFDSLAPSKAPPPIATLAPRDFHKNTYRHVAPLGAAVHSRRVESAERGTQYEEPDEMSMDGEVDDEPTRKLSVRDLLLSDDQVDSDLKLPKIHRAISNEDGESPQLPGVNDIKGTSPPRYPHVPIKRHTEDEIVRGVKRLELGDPIRAAAPLSELTNEEDVERMRVEKIQRRRHALMIRSWILAVNLDFRSRRLRDLNLGDIRETQQEEDEDELDEEDRVTIKQEQGDDDEYDSEEQRTPTETSKRLGLDEIAA